MAVHMVMIMLLLLLSLSFDRDHVYVANLARASFSCSCGGEVLSPLLPGLVHGTTHRSQVHLGLYNGVKGPSRIF